MYRYSYFGIAFCILTLSSPLVCFNRSLFFRTSSFWDEPRFERPYLTTLDIQLLGGSNHRSRNNCGKRTHLFTLYGPENIVALSKASAEEPFLLPGNPRNICFRAVADIFEADINFYQNATRGFFLQFHLPVIAAQICPSGFMRDESCRMRPSKTYQPVWQKSLTLLAPFLKQFNISLNRISQGGLSDSTLFFGWTYSYEDTCYLDFIDTTIKTGILFPTGKCKNPNQLFDIPYGYNGHWAIPLSWDLSIGIFDWLTFGFHSDALFFRNKKRCLRMRTARESNTGIIVLGKDLANVNQGIVWRLGTYLKADHFYNGLSFLLAFSYEQKNKDTVRPCNTIRFNPDQVNKDLRFAKWARSIVHLQAEYDFAQEDSYAGTRFGIFYNGELTGLRVFNISTTGGYLGLDMTWSF